MLEISRCLSGPYYGLVFFSFWTRQWMSNQENSIDNCSRLPYRSISYWITSAFFLQSGSQWSVATHSTPLILWFLQPSSLWEQRNPLQKEYTPSSFLTTRDRLMAGDAPSLKDVIRPYIREVIQEEMDDLKDDIRTYFLKVRIRQCLFCLVSTLFKPGLCW